MEKIAVAMSVYRSDKLGLLKQCVDSLINQTYENVCVYIMVDGPVEKQVEFYLAGLSNGEHFNVEFCEENCGLATRLNQIVDKVVAVGGYDYIARMDADDISAVTRFSKQVEFLTLNKNVSVVGSDMIEVNESGDKLFYKSMNSEHDDLYANIIRRCPLNHPSVMFRTEIFHDPMIRYKPWLKNTQDYYLWVDLFDAGYRFANINEALLYFRIDGEFHSRRGLKKAVNDFNSRRYAFKVLRCYSFLNIIHTGLLFVLRVSPSFVKKIAYSKLR